MIFLYRMIFFGEIVTTNDELERHPINEWIENYIGTNDDVPQWYPNLFSGMPSYGGYIYMNGDPTKYIREEILFNPGQRIWLYLIIWGIGMYVLLRSLGISKYSSLIGGLVSCLTPYTFGLINAGHLNKIFAMAYIPWVIYSSINLIRTTNIKSILILSIFTALQLWTNHPQVAYYTWMVIGFYYFWLIISSIRQGIKPAQKILKPLLYCFFGIIIALFMVSDPYIDIYKFQSESNRGSASVLDNSGQTSKGTKWNYATQWSFHPLELISFIYPYHYGLQNHADLKRGSYWGFMPFTQSTHYLGILILIFSVFGYFQKRLNQNVVIFSFITILILFTGFGSYFSIIYKPFYDYFPFFSKFRVPSMIYLLLAIIIPFLGAKGMDLFFEKNKEKDFQKKILRVIGFLILFTIVLLIIGKATFSFSASSDARYHPSQISKLFLSRTELFEKGLIITLFISISLIAMVWGFLNDKLNRYSCKILLFCLFIFDIAIIANEFMDTKPAKNLDRLFKKDEIVKYLQNDLEYFRIFPVNQLGSNRYSYWNIESIGGYRPIKLRAYQDLMDAGGFNKPQILDMLNVKYIISNKEIKSTRFSRIDGLNNLYQNNSSLPKAWIVENVINAESQRESLMEILLSGFNPKNTAIINGYSGKYINSKGSGTVNIISRDQDKIEIRTSSKTGGILVLSEIFYKNGWKALVNGQNSRIYQANHILRAVEIPSGISNISFIYDTSEWKNIRIMSRVSIFTVLFLLGYFIRKESQDKIIDK